MYMYYSSVPTRVRNYICITHLHTIAPPPPAPDGPEDNYEYLPEPQLAN